MTIDEVIDVLSALDGVLLLRPGPGDGTPEIAWGDVFAYYAPDGVAPQTQPFATVVTKDYPDEPSSGLDRDGAFRVNVAAGAEAFQRWTGHPPREATAPTGDLTDRLLAHPVYGSLGWLAVVDPGEATREALRELLVEAHRLAEQRWQRRRG